MAFQNGTISQLLQSLDLGSPVAEVDRLLEVARIETSAFSDLLADRVDLVPGTKGSGKSALFRMIVEFLPGFLLKQRKVVVAHGVQALGDSVFQAFAAQFSALTEEDFVDFWCIYLISLAHAQFVSSDDYAPMLSNAAAAIERFRAECVRAGIPEIRAKRTLKDVLGWALTALSKVRPRIRYEVPHEGGAFEVDLLGHPKEATEERAASDQPASLPRYVSDIRQTLEEVLKLSNLSLWLMVDRLDEVFPRRSDTERRALRGLLRAVKQFSTPLIRVKLFIRDDMLDNLVSTDAGFTALTHLTARQADTLRWEPEQIQAMLAKRFFANDGIAAFFNVDAERVNSSAAYRLQCLSKLFPPTVFRGTRQSSTLTWIYKRCSDGRGVVTPRDVLDLLLKAKQRQHDICSGDPDGETAWLIGADAIQYGLEQLSEHKRRTYLQAEFPHLWQHMAKFIGGKTEYSEEALVALLGKEAKPAAEDLVSIGFLQKKSGSANTTYTVPFLYRYGMDMSQGKA
ncbi:MAG TPA: hypothetical protein VJ738_01930 [Steroidobacteraceae bacterium]|nr:hypothetical protein [Steroidobacteraceae bacterium]